MPLALSLLWSWRTQLIPSTSRRSVCGNRRDGTADEDARRPSGILIGAGAAAALTRRRKLKHRGGRLVPRQNPPVDGSCILPFAYMEAFMLAVLRAWVPAKRRRPAPTC